MIGAAAAARLGAMLAVTQPRREELEALVRHYHHVESERERAGPEGTVRHHQELRLREDEERFARLLAAYVPDEESRSAWHAYLHHHGAEPPGPPAVSPLVFKGRSEAGSVVEIRHDRSGALAVEVDGRLVERLASGHAPIGERPAVYRLDGVEFRELFDADPGAARALRDFLTTGGAPPWEHASVLLADGLIDVNFGLTARGQRALRR